MTPVCELDIALLDADAKLVVAEKEKALLGKFYNICIYKGIMQISEQNVFENNLFSLGF